MAKKWRIPSIFFGILLLSSILFGFVHPVHAFDFKGGEKIVVESGEVIEDDLYVGANIIEIKGTIKGDLVAFGTSIILAPGGVVEGDMLAAGQSIIVDGKIMDDARLACAGISLDSNADVSDDLIVFGYSLEAKPDSRVGGDVLFFGGQSLLEGEIGGDLTVNSMGVEINGRVGGDVEAEVGSAEDIPPVSPMQFIPNMPVVPSVPGGLTFGSETQIEGNLNYKAPQEVEIPSWAVGGDVEYEKLVTTPTEEGRKPEPTTGQRVGNWLLGLIRRLLALLLVGLLFVWLLPNFIEQSAARLQAKPWVSLGLGLIVYFGFYFVVAAIFTLTIILTVVFGVLTLAALAWLVFGIGFTVIINLILAFIIAVMFVSKIIVSYLGGRLILERLKPEWSLNRFWPFILGLMLLVIIVSIPYIGWLLNLIAVFFGLGAMLIWIKDFIEMSAPMPDVKKVQ